MEFGDYIWNHHEKCIQISTNMPGIGLKFVNFEKQNDFVWMVKLMDACKVLKVNAVQNTIPFKAL